MTIKKYLNVGPLEWSLTVTPERLFDPTFKEKYGRPHTSLSHGKTQLLSTVQTKTLSGMILLFDPKTDSYEPIYQSKYFLQYYFDKDDLAIYIMESDFFGYQYRKEYASCSSRIVKFDLETRKTSTIIESMGTSFFAFDLTLLPDGRLLVFDLASKTVVLLSRKGETLERLSIGTRLGRSMCLSDEGILFASWSTINDFYKTEDPYDCIYRLGWDGDLKRIHTTWLPGTPGHIYGLQPTRYGIAYVSNHSLVMTVKGGEKVYRRAGAKVYH